MGISKDETKHEIESELESELTSETLKWLEKIEKEVKRVEYAKAEVRINPSEAKEYLDNVIAYIKDCKWFIDRKDFVRAFECVVWAWAWLEIGTKFGILKKL